MYVFEMPEIGEGVVEGEVVRWLVAEGDRVAVDQPLCEIMTDKATVQISSPRAGKVQKLHGRPGDILKVHSPLVTFDLGEGAAPAPAKHTPAPAAPKAAPAPAPAPAPKAPAPAPAPAPVAAPVAAVPAPAPAPAPLAKAASTEIPAPIAAKMPRPPGAPVLASPAVRQEAGRSGVDLSQIAGSGKDGRITRADVAAALTAPAAPAVPASAMPEPKALPAIQAPAPVAGDERIRIIGLRRKIAEKMVQAYRTAPHFTYVDEVDATELVALRDQLNAVAGPRGLKLSYLPFILKALAATFKEFPTLNAVMDEENFELVVRKDINIGLATDTDAGLYVPVIKHVDRKSLWEIALEIQDLTKRTREGKARLDELQGGTFTVTSVGNIGGRFATPILNHPEVAILGVNQIHDRPMAINGQVLIRKMMYLSPSFDHRVIDGAVAARFVSALKATLERPQSLLLDLR